MPVNNSGKRHLEVMQEADGPYSSDETPEPQRQVAHQVRAMDAGIELEQGTLDGSLIWVSNLLTGVVRQTVLRC